jgi:hypothetical protein
MVDPINLNELISSLSFWEISGYVGLFGVLIGVIGEAVHEFSASPKWNWWKSKGGRLSALLLIVGLAVEGVAQVNANNISGRVIAFLGDQEATTRERAAKLELELARLRAPRLLTPEQRQEVVSRLRRFEATAVAINANGDDPEVKAFASQLWSVFIEAKWKPSVFQVNSRSPAGLLVESVSGADDRSRAAASELVSALAGMDIFITGPDPIELGNPTIFVRLIVGRKPSGETP